MAVGFTPYPNPTSGNSMTSKSIFPRPQKKTESGKTAGGTSWTTEYGPSLEDDLATRDKYNAQAEARRMGSMSSLLSSQAGPGARVSRGSGASAEQEQAARNAAFARAKDTQGQIARRNLDTLSGVVTDKGLGAGSTFEAAKTGQIVGSAAGALGELVRDQALSDVGHAERVADLEFTGGINQRGQEIQRQQALMSLLNQAGVVY